MSASVALQQMPCKQHMVLTAAAPVIVITVVVAVVVAVAVVATIITIITIITTIIIITTITTTWGTTEVALLVSSVFWLAI